MFLKECDLWQIPFLMRRVGPCFTDIFTKKSDLPTGTWYTTPLVSQRGECELALEIRTYEEHDAESCRYIYSISCDDPAYYDRARLMLDRVTINDVNSDVELLVSNFNKNCRDRSFFLRDLAEGLKLEYVDNCGRNCCLQLNRSAIGEFIHLTHIDLSVFVDYPFATLDADGCDTLESCAEVLITRYIDCSRYFLLDELQLELNESILKEARMARVCLGKTFDVQVSKLVKEFPMAFIERQKEELISLIKDGNPGMPY